MSTATTQTGFEHIRRDLHQIGHQLLETDAFAERGPLPELVALEGFDHTLKTFNQTFLDQCRALYQGLQDVDLESAEGISLLADLRGHLNNRLQTLDQSSAIGNKGRRSFYSAEAGQLALEHEARLGLQDGLLSPIETQMVARIALAPSLRPGLYSLAFDYREERVVLAGAVVIVEKNAPVVSSMNGTDALGATLLFTPRRGLESFTSLADLDNRLRQTLDSPLGQAEFADLLPRRYQHLPTAAIWPLVLHPINGEPPFEHSYDALIAKRGLDIDTALSLVDNPAHSSRQLLADLDYAVAAAAPDLSARLELRAQVMLDRNLLLSAPAWYRSAPAEQRSLVAQHLGAYNRARETLTALFGPAATPATLARYQLLEHLADDLDIDDLVPERLLVTTRRTVVGVGEYQQQDNLVQLALHGLHPGDEQPGSRFMTHTRITYDDHALLEDYLDLTPAYLAQLLNRLNPRLAFRGVQQQIHATPELKSAIGALLDQRINVLAYVALLQGHISETDYQLIEDLRAGRDSKVSALTLSFHGAQLNDLWVLRRVDAQGQVDRLLLCAPDAPSTQQFFGFDKEIDCQAFVLGWSLDNHDASRPTMANYLVNRVALRFRSSMRKILQGLSLKPQDREHLEVILSTPCPHADCLKSMTEHALSTQVDDYLLATPPWYHSASDAQRRRLTSLAQNLAGASRTHDDNPLSEAHFPNFETYLKHQARLSLNRLLGRPANDIDPDEVRVLSPRRIGQGTPPPMSYTRLYRDGYEDGIGFINDKFSTSATFEGPAGIDLSPLTPQNVARSVTGVWIGQRYTDQVRAQLLSTDSPGYQARRDAALAITQLQMLNSALESQLQGHLASVDLAWLEQSIQHMGDSDTATRTRYPIHRVTIEGEWLMDLYLFSHADHPTLLYTPNAPDNIAFREARLFNYLLKHTDGMVGYLALRAAQSSQQKVRNFLEQAKAQLPAALDKTSASPARYDSLEHVAPLSDLHQALYNMKLQRKIDDVLATTVNRTQMITDILWTVVELVTAVATAPFPIWSLSSGLLLAFKDAMLALHAYNQGDYSQALQHYFGYLLNSAGGLLTDLRPALVSAGVIKKAPRLLLRKAAAEQAAQLIKQLEPEPPALAGLQPVLFNGQSLWAPRSPDALGRYLLSRFDPVSGKLLSTAILANPTSDGRWIRSGVAGGGPKYAKLPEPPVGLERYEIPSSEWRNFEAVLDPRFAEQQIGLSQGAAGFEAASLHNSLMHLQPLRDIHVKQVANLTADAQAFFKALPAEPPRADILDFEATTPHSQILRRVFNEGSGLIVGETAASIASKQFLITNMPQLAELGVKRLYIEFLPRDVFKLKLTKHNTGKLSKHIDKHLARVDTNQGFTKDAPYSYRALMLEARKHGISLHGLDASSSYDLDNVLSLSNDRSWVPQPTSSRNFYSHKVLQSDLDAAPSERWVVLADQRRLNTYNDVPGLADLQKSLSLRIEDVAEGQPQLISKDVPGTIPGDPNAKADFRLTLQTTYRAVPPPGAPGAGAATDIEPHFSQFAIADQHVKQVKLMQMEPRGLDTRYSSPFPLKARALEAFTDTRERLDNAASAFFTSLTRPARSALPTLPAASTPQSFIKSVYERGNGLIIGESHSAQSSKAWLIEHLAEMKRQGVKTLYLEHLQTDLHQIDLNTFSRTGRMPDDLNTFLKAQDSGHMGGYKGPATYTNVLHTASKLGIRVRALDCVASYHVKGLYDAKRSRMTLFNFHAHKVIEADQVAQGAHKWVAFMGSAHTNTYMNVPGLAQLQDAVSLHIHDVLPGRGRALHTGYWQVAREPIGDNPWVALGSDFKLEIGVTGHRPADPAVRVDRSRIKRIGEFLVERPSPTETLLLHRSNNNQVVSTPIMIDDNGLFHIDRWESIKHRRYITQDALIEDLITVVKLTPLES